MPAAGRGGSGPEGRTLLGRALALLCPACGRSPVFRGLKMRSRCPACGFVPEREQGYWLGAMYVNYGVAVALAIAVHVVLEDVYGVSMLAQLLVLLPGSALFVVWFFRYSRMLWLALDLSCDPPADFSRGGLDEEASTCDPIAE